MSGYNTLFVFTHFTRYKSKQKLLICDLKKVTDLYTDPQIHTPDGEKHGLGNMRKRCIEKWTTSPGFGLLCQ